MQGATSPEMPGTIQKNYMQAKGTNERFCVAGVFFAAFLLKSTGNLDETCDLATDAEKNNAMIRILMILFTL